MCYVLKLYSKAKEVIAQGETGMPSITLCCLYGIYIYLSQCVTALPIYPSKTLNSPFHTHILKKGSIYTFLQGAQAP
jgi:hypothetical protein